jgi:anti-anti-sigma factor
VWGASLFAVTDEVAVISPITRRWAAAPDVAATLAGITSGVLAAVAAAEYSSVAWACGRWLTGEAPTHHIVARLDALQAELRQGPCLDALREQHTVAVPDMGSEARWPVFAARAAELDVGSMLSLPLSVRQESLGVLNLYAARPHAFTDDDESVGALFANRAAIALYRAAERDHLRALADRDVIGQATGILIERHHLTASEAFDRLVRDSQDANLTLADAARRVVNGHDHAAANSRRTARRPGLQDTVRTPAVTHGLLVTRDSVGDAIVVRASGEVDLHTAAALAAALRESCDSARPPGPLVIDLTGIQLFSAAGLKLLVTTQQHCHERQVALRVVATDRSVLRALHITKLDEQFDVGPSLEEATRPRIARPDVPPDNTPHRPTRTRWPGHARRVNLE